MTVLDCIQRGILYLDGGTGTFLQARGLGPGELPETWNLSRPEEITALHRAYYEAGSHVVCTNTFGANRFHFDGAEGRAQVEEVVRAAVSCAKRARDTARCGQQNRFIALDIGPLGHILEPLGDLPFEQAVALFAQVVRAGARAGADLVMIETMNDCYETKAAVLAAKENCTLPIFVSNVYDESGKLMSGTTPEAMVALLEGLGVDAIGINCSLGPGQMAAHLPKLLANASVPVLVKPNAGMPHLQGGETVYDVNEAEFAAVMREMVKAGARIVGGCCGTIPSYIRALTAATQDLAPQPIEQKQIPVISSYSHAVRFDGAPVLIGERINPTGKKKMKEALRRQDMEYMLQEGIAQQEQGAQVLDVNVGLPEIDEPVLLARCVRELQGVCGLPLQIDTSDPVAMERAMRVYNGKPMVNSVNGNPEVMDAVFPLVRKYGGFVVCLTLDETGIPKTAAGRLAIAQKIAAHAATYGIGIQDLIFDPLAMAISTDAAAARVALDTIALVRAHLGAGCLLGVSNISFGLPNRDFVTSAFFAMALARGLKAAIMNPYSAEMQQIYHSCMALDGWDANCTAYIKYAQRMPAAETKEPVASARPQVQPQEQEGKLEWAIVHGLCRDAARFAREELAATDPMTLINEKIVPALDKVGQGFEQKTVFLPQLLMSAEAAGAAFEEVKRKIPAAEEAGPSIVLATVKGDIHDIGKNIVKALLENYGYRIIDLGKDVLPEKVVEAAIKADAGLVGLSALMTTTVPAMAQTIALLKKSKPDARVMVGGAVLTQAYADQIGADYYAKNAMQGVRYAERLLKGTG